MNQPETPRINDKGLSQLQRAILCDIWRVYQQDSMYDRIMLKDINTGEEIGQSYREYWGAKWSGLHVEVKRRNQNYQGRGQSTSQRAADSRALRRLWQRGLVKLNNYFGDGKYTTHVSLTDAGKDLAQRLTSKFDAQTLTVQRGI